MAADLVTGLLPVLGRSLEPGFNVFDVMHHGVHEKQMSNVFRWLLEPEGTHGFGDRFVRIFVDEINQELSADEALPVGDYWVRQEVNTSPPGDSADIADLVLESDSAVVVVENFLTSDGHGHAYDRYLTFAGRNKKHGVVVLLCRDHDSSLQTQGWQDAAVLTYRALVSRLHVDLETDAEYRRKNPEAYSFIEQLHRKFVTGRSRVNDQDVLGFVIAMCQTGEARRYQEKHRGPAAERFASDLAEQARERFGEGRHVLNSLKERLKAFATGPLRQQLDVTLGAGSMGKAGSYTGGIYQWTIEFGVAQPGLEAPAKLQFKFGPSAWFANESDPEWVRTVDPAAADYSRLFVTRLADLEIRQSAVSLQEVLDGLDPSDHRLHDEVIEFLRGA